jgi:WS/DGAT/MGAT family acyltransferase
VRAVRDSLSGGLRNVSSTPLNQPIGGHRRFDWLAISLDEVKQVKNQLGGTVNDVVLTTVAGAVRRFLERRRVHVDTLDFRVMAPVSVRSAQERGTLGNRVSAWMVPMPLAERDPKRRLQIISETTSRLKESKQALGAEVLTQVGEWTPSTLLSLGARMASRLLPFNLVVTNVPGPQIPLYMLGAKMLDNYGLVPLMDYLCMGIVLFSYSGQLCWGFTGEWDLLPDLHDFVLDVDRAFGELRKEAGAVATIMAGEPAKTAAASANGKRRRPRAPRKRAGRPATSPLPH